MAELVTNNSTLGEARRRFVLLTKRYDLLANADILTNTDNGANRYLQEATTWLDLNVRHQREQRREIRTIASGEYLIITTDIIRFDELYLINATERINLTPLYMPYKDFMACVTLPIDEWDEGDIQAWTIAPHILAPGTTRRGLPLTEARDAINTTDTDAANSRRLPVFENHINNGDFHIVNQWVLGTGWTISDEKLVATTVAMGEAAYASAITSPSSNNIYRGYRIKPNVKYRVRCVITASAGTVTIKVGDTVVVATQGAGTVDTTVVTASDFNTDTDDGENFRIECDSVTPFSGTVDDVVINEVTTDPATVELSLIYLYPKVASDYTVELLGVFHSELLQEDSQWSVWTRFYMDLLVKKAAQLYYEELGNSSRAAFFAAACDSWINSIDDRLVEVDLVAYDGEIER